MVKQILRSVFLAGALALGLAGQVQAIPVQWTLNLPTLNSGGTLTGTFVYDADTNQYSNINILADDTTTGADGLYTQFLAGDARNLRVALDGVVVPADLTGFMPIVDISADDTFTNAGGTNANIIASAGGDCGNASCSSYGSAFGSRTTEGTYEGVPLNTQEVPVPAPLGLIVAGLGALFFAGRRRKAC